MPVVYLGAWRAVGTRNPDVSRKSLKVKEWCEHEKLSDKPLTHNLFESRDISVSESWNKGCW